MTVVDFDHGSRRPVMAERTKGIQMCSLRSAVVATVAMLVATTSALAADLSGTVNPGLGKVQWSSNGQPTYARYDVTIFNTGQANISGWRFRAKTSVTGGTGTPTATFNKTYSDPSCNLLNPDVQTEFVCDFSTETLAGVTGTRSFSVVLNAPASGTEIDFSWHAFWDESGNGGSDGFKDATPTTLYPPNPDEVSSVIPAGAPVLTFFTGTGIATPTDPWVTIVTVPSTSLATSADVQEGALASTCAANLLDCRTSTLTIPIPTGASFGTAGARPLVDPLTGKSQFLEITVLRDASTIAKGAKIDSATVYYRHDSSDPDPFPLPKDVVPSCADPSDQPLPRAGKPCEDRSQRLEYPKKNTPKSPVQAGFESDWRFVFYAVENGKYAN